MISEDAHWERMHELGAKVHGWGGYDNDDPEPDDFPEPQEDWPRRKYRRYDEAPPEELNNDNI